MSMNVRRILLVVMTAVLLLIIGLSTMIFNDRLNRYMREDMDMRLQEIVEPNLMSFQLQTKEQIKKVKTLAQVLGNETGILGSEKDLALLQAAVEQNGLLRCAIAMPDGSFITHDSRNDGNVSKDPFFIESMQGNFFISDPRPAVVDPTKTVILFAGPIERDGMVIGSVIYSYLCDDMDQIFNLNFMEGHGRMMVMKEDGTPLIGYTGFVDAGDNLLESLRVKCAHQAHDAAACTQISGESGQWDITPKGETPLYCRYDRLIFNDWYMLSLIPEDVALKGISYVTKIQQQLGYVLIVCGVLYVGVLFWLWLGHRRNVDKKTGALTLEGFKRKAPRLIKRMKGQSYVLVQLDIKDFKLINRIYNFETGDRVIKNIVASLTSLFQGMEAIFARAGVDTFVLLLPYKGSAWLEAQRNTFIDGFHSRMGDGFSARVNFPTGQHLLTPDEMENPDINALLEKVNFAHRAAKQNFNVIIDYAEDIEKEALLEKKIEDRMMNALTGEEFTLYLQPKFALPSEEICGAEALVRWKVDGQYFMYPTDFIPILERNGFIVQLDKYMFELAVRKVRQLLDDGEQPVPVSVNFSRHHLDNDRFVEDLCAITDRYRVPRSYMEVELTESAVFGHVDRIVELLKQLHTAGFTMSMDDFGSGYSSLAQLKDIQVDVLKIDKGFFNDSTDWERARVVIASVFEMAQRLGITTVAEGIETKEQVELMCELHCDMVQGYYFSRPIPGDQIDALIKEHRTAYEMRS